MYEILSILSNDQISMFYFVHSGACFEVFSFSFFMFCVQPLLKIYSDKTACIQWSKNKTTKNLRHLQINENAVRESALKLLTKQAFNNASRLFRFRIYVHKTQDSVIEKK